VVSALAISIAIGYAVNFVGVPIEMPQQLDEAHEHGWLPIVCVALLGAVLVGQLWRWGMKPWFEILEGSHPHDHDHAGGDHGHEHDHAHHHGEHDHHH
jgi:ABC-type nickel/cobalt efflux system permease component RcnA